MKLRSVFLFAVYFTSNFFGFVISLPDETVCGFVKENERIIGGEVADLGEFPWITALEYTNKRTGENVGIKCSGSVINSKYILTAAHCLVARELEPIKVWLGEWKFLTDPDCKELIAIVECADPVQKFSIKEKIPHPFYRTRNGYNDIGLILLEKEIQFSDYIKPICLPMQDLVSPKPGTRFTIAGWGSTENGSSSDVLLKVKVPKVSNEICQKNYGSIFNISEHQLCAGGEAGRDSCLGDTGGPLMMIRENRLTQELHWYQEGISSMGVSPCGREGFPAIYIQVSNYITWIISVISEE